MPHGLQTFSPRRKLNTLTAHNWTLFLLALLLLYPAWPASAQRTDTDFMRSLEDNMIETGVQYDQIPALNQPRYVTIADAALSMRRDEQVFILRLGGAVRIYPQRIMVWHEVVNEDINDIQVTLTYSPLTGALAAYMSRVGGRRTTFGVTGMLLNANTVLYDRTTGSLWSQLYGVCFEGDLRGSTLTRFPVIWTTWEQAMKTYPKALVLSSATGYRRSYSRDPYGQYEQSDSYYHNEKITFPVMNRDSRMPPKERIHGFTLGSTAYAIMRDNVRRDGAVNFAAGTTPLVALWDQRLGTVRVYERMLEGKMLEFDELSGKITDTVTRSEWNYDGECEYGVLRGRALRQVTTIDSMWFAWVAFHPDTQLVPR